MKKPQIHAAAESFFNEKAPIWADHYDGGASSYRTRLTRFEQALTAADVQEGTILDFGCGTGDLALHLAASGYVVTGCDIARAMIEVAEKRDSENRVTWIHLDSESPKIPVPPESVDAVTMSSVLEYVEDLESTLSAISAVLKPGGRLFATVPNTSHRSRRLEGLVRPFGRLFLAVPLIRRSRRLRQYLNYLRLSRNRFASSKWNEVAGRSGFEGCSTASESSSSLEMLVWRKPDSTVTG